MAKSCGRAFGSGAKFTKVDLEKTSSSRTQPQELAKSCAWALGSKKGSQTHLRPNSPTTGIGQILWSGSRHRHYGPRRAGCRRSLGGSLVGLRGPFEGRWESFGRPLRILRRVLGDPLGSLSAKSIDTCVRKLWLPIPSLLLCP